MKITLQEAVYRARLFVNGGCNALTDATVLEICKALLAYAEMPPLMHVPGVLPASALTLVPGEVTFVPTPGGVVTVTPLRPCFEIPCSLLSDDGTCGACGKKWVPLEKPTAVDVLAAVARKLDLDAPLEPGPLAPTSDLPHPSSPLQSIQVCKCGAALPHDVPCSETTDPEAISTPTCSHCNDTHQMQLGERKVMCTHCPVPCGDCRMSGGLPGAYCNENPCRCSCHVGPG